MKYDRAADKETKFKKEYTIKEFKELTEDAGGPVRTIVLLGEDGREIAKLVIKDDELVESVATTDAQDSGLYADFAKKYGIKEDELVFTHVKSATAQMAVESDKKLKKNLAMGYGATPAMNTPVPPAPVSNMALMRSMSDILKKRKMKKAAPKYTPEQLEQMKAKQRPQNPQAAMDSRIRQIKEAHKDPDVSSSALEQKVRSRYGLAKNDSTQHPHPDHPMRIPGSDAARMTPDMNAMHALHYATKASRMNDPQVKSELMDMAKHHQSFIPSGHRWKMNKAKGDDAPTIDYSKFNKINRKVKEEDAPTLDYSTFEQPKTEPKWKRDMEAKKYHKQQTGIKQAGGLKTPGRKTAMQEMQERQASAKETVNQRQAGKAKYEGQRQKVLSEEKSRMKKSRSPRERQIIDKAIQDIHTDKMQVQDVLPKVPKHLQDDVMKELRRRGGDAYPERGPDARLQKKRGVPKGVDPAKQESCVKQVKQDSDVDNPYAVCNAALQKMDQMLRKGKLRKGSKTATILTD